MAIDFDTLIENSKLTEEQKTQALALFSVEGLRTSIEETALHEANETFKADRAKLQSNWDKANAEFLEMQENFAKVSDSLTATQKEKDEAAGKLAAAEKKAKELEGKTVDVEKLKKELIEEMQTFNIGARSYELEALEAARQHRELFGTEISVKQLAIDALTAKKSPEAYWEEKYGVAAKRKEVAEAAQKKHDDEVEKRGYERRLSEEANPATRTAEPSRNPFYVPKGGDAKDAVNPWDTEDTPPEETALLNELKRVHAGA